MGVSRGAERRPPALLRRSVALPREKRIAAMWYTRPNPGRVEKLYRGKGRLCRVLGGGKLPTLQPISPHGPSSAYQEDHLISLEIGGDPTDPRNLWPEPYPRASAMDQIENEINHDI